MANGMQLLTGHQEVNHISAADEAGLNTALITGDNVVIANEREITCEADLTGTLTVGAFVALFSGRKVACAGATGTYTQPSAGMYRRVSVGVLYTKNTQDDDVEDCDLAVYTSAAESASQSTAAGYDTGKPSDTVIESETTEAYFELFDLVVSTSEIVTKTPVYSVFAGEKNEHARVDNLVERMETAEDDIDTLQGQTANIMPRMTSAESAISNLQPRVTTAESNISNLQTRMTTAESGIEFARDTAMYKAYIRRYRGTKHGITGVTYLDFYYEYYPLYVFVLYVNGDDLPTILIKSSGTGTYTVQKPTGSNATFTISGPSYDGHQYIRVTPQTGNLVSGYCYMFGDIQNMD